MNQEEIQKLINIRTLLIEEHKKRQDWKGNPNAIMTEVELIKILNKTIKDIDSLLSAYVQFS